MKMMLLEMFHRRSIFIPSFQTHMQGRDVCVCLCVSLRTFQWKVLRVSKSATQITPVPYFFDIRSSAKY